MTMRKRARGNLGIVTFVCALFLCAALVTDAKSLDFIEGTWSDVCSCPVPCPCWRSQRSTVHRCVNFHVFRVTHGRYGGINLAGSTFVLLALPAAEYHAPVANKLFIDEGLDKSKVLAIENLLGKYFGSIPVTRGKINLKQYGAVQEIQMPGVFSLRTSFPDDLNISSDVSAYLYPWLSNPRQGIVDKVVYIPSGGGIIEYSGTNAISAAFQIPSDPN